MRGESVPASDRLMWIEPLGLGFLPARRAANEVYDEAYWAEYRRRDATRMGEALTAARCDLVRRHLDPQRCVDVGIGGGAFVAAAGCLGTDVNPLAVDWLEKNGRRWDGAADVDALCFWDSLEHIEWPAALLARARRFVFVSMPVYDSRAAVVASRHFKPDEHVWYCSADGLVNLMRVYGFALVEHNRMESDLGRDGIMSFVFGRTR